jgi:ribosomal protein S18 acetylase RimI-like enzyme
VGPARYRQAVPEQLAKVLPTIRRAVNTDLERLIGLHEQFCAVDGHEFDERRARAAFGPLLADDDRGVVWLAETPAATLGYAVLTWGWSIEAGGGEAVLDEIFVIEPRRGVGSALLACVVSDARSRPLTRIFLETEASNALARNWYARHGFVVEDSVWMNLGLADAP